MPATVKVQQGAVIGLSVEPTGFHKRRGVRILPHVGGHIVYSGLTRKALYVSAQVEKITARRSLEPEVLYGSRLTAEGMPFGNPAIEIHAVPYIVRIRPLLPPAQQKPALPPAHETRQKHSPSADKIIKLIVCPACPAAFLV